MTSLAKGIFIVGAKRTPFGTFGGKLAKTHITELQTIASKAALAAANVKPENVDSVVIGNVISSVASDGGYLARHVLLKSGVSVDKPALVVNRLCGSGFQAVVSGLQEIQTGAANVVLTGGVENMSAAPFIVRNIRFGGIPLGTSPVLEDAFWQGSIDTYCNLTMALTAEKLGEQFQLTKEEVDQFALQSQQRWKAGAAVVLTGGVEIMSASPFILRGCRFESISLGENPILHETLIRPDTYCNLIMALTAEKLGALFELTKEDVNIYSFNSQLRWKAAQDAGKFKDEIVPVPIKVKKETVNFEVDEHPRPNTTLEGLQKLPTMFKKNGLVTAGSASGICDGAGAVVIASEKALKKHSLKPLARVVAHSVVGVDPSIMGFGPSPAIRNILKITGKTLNDIDLIEINEAFGAQVLACAKDLKVDMSKFNVNGGAIALGHPLAASGARITGHLIYELKRRGGKYAIGSACIGGGQGIAIMIEAL